MGMRTKREPICKLLEKRYLLNYALVKIVFSFIFLLIYWVVEKLPKGFDEAWLTFLTVAATTIIYEVVFWYSYSSMLKPNKTRIWQAIFPIGAFIFLLTVTLLGFQEITNSLSLNNSTILASVLGAIFGSGCIDFVKTAFENIDDTNLVGNCEEIEEASSKTPSNLNES